MVFGFGRKNKTVKELRKNHGFTARELAERLGLEPVAIKRVDQLRLKEVPEPLRSRLEGILDG